MIESDRVKGYDAGAMLLHWTIALAVVCQLAIGFTMSRLDVLPDGTRFLLFQWHKTIGILVLALTLARIAWRLFNPPPAHAPMPLAERLLAGLVHGLFYVLMLLVPLSGWLLVSVSATKIPTLLFLSEHLPWPNLPVPAALDAKQTEDVAETMHIWLACSFVGLIVLHVAGALKHSLVDRAPSFSRMLPIGGIRHQSTALLAIPVAVALFAVFLGGGIVTARSGPETAGTALATPAAAPMPSGWVIDKASSSLGYNVTFSGNTVSGKAGGWDAAVRFDPNDLPGSSARIVVDASSVTIDDAFIRSNLSGPDGLDSAAFPTITISMGSFEKTPTGFLAKGTMTIRGIEVPIALPFTFTEDAKGQAKVEGSAEFDRMAFKLGAGNDATGAWLGLKVTVTLLINARQPSPAI